MQTDRVLTECVFVAILLPLTSPHQPCGSFCQPGLTPPCFLLFAFRLPTRPLGSPPSLIPLCPILWCRSFTPFPRSCFSCLHTLHPFAPLTFLSCLPSSAWLPLSYHVVLITHDILTFVLCEVYFLVHIPWNHYLFPVDFLFLPNRSQ